MKPNIRIEQCQVAADTVSIGGIQWLTKYEVKVQLSDRDTAYAWKERIEKMLAGEVAQPEQGPVAWTPVATAMPKAGKPVLACYLNRLGNVRRIRSMWIEAKTREATGDYDDWGEYDSEADTNWWPQGWYECIDNWDDYSAVFVVEGKVTHWMPLPEAPYADSQEKNS